MAVCILPAVTKIGLLSLLLIPYSVRLQSIPWQTALKVGEISTGTMSEPSSDQIAIIGIGCKVPGGDNVEQFWRILENGENHVIEIPKERWNNDAFFDTDHHAVGKSYVRRAGLLKDHLAFDNKLFNINDFEADQMDPQQRFVLECTHMAMEDAGITREKLAGSNTGVYVGAVNGDYRGLFTAKSPVVGNYTVTGISNSIIAARVSFVFDLRGPSITLDTACSSALLAIHIGAQAIKTGDCEMALCGGTNCLMSPDVFVHLSKAHMVSPTGQCFAFSDKADGYTRGEGCGMVILKRLKDALRDGDRVWATIYRDGVKPRWPFGDCWNMSIGMQMKALSIASSTSRLTELGHQLVIL